MIDFLWFFLIFISIFARAEIASMSYEEDETIKAKKMVALKAETIPFYLDKLESLVKENGGHFALSKLTWADMYFAGVLDYLNYMAKCNLVENTPALKSLVESVNNLDPIKAWIKARPVNEL